MNRREFLQLSLKAAFVTGTSGGLLTLATAFACTVNRQDITLAGLPAAFDGFRVALLSDFHHSHNPDYVERIRDERVGLVLSGHTHGGQCVFPIIGAPILPSRYGQKYASGLCYGPASRVFVTRGVGTAFPPIRFGCPAEIALLTLHSGDIT